MNEQDLFTVWPQIITELLVFLGRPSVQLQLGLVIIGLVTAVPLGKLIQRRLRPTMPSEGEEVSLGRKLAFYLVTQLTTAVTALLLIQILKFILVSSSRRTGLVDAIVGIIILYLVLKMVLVAALAVGEPAGIQLFQKTLIIPLFVVIITVQLLNIFFRDDRLANIPVFSLFDNTVTLSALFLITAGFYLWLVGVNAFGQGVHHVATQYGGADAGSTQATLTLLRYILIILGLVYVLFRLNFNTTTIAAISGGLSVGIGFALSTILSNFVSGILLLFERTLHPGDIIEYNGILCTVEMITIRSIRVRTFDNVELIIPNSEFVTAPFTTYTGDSKVIRLKIPVGTSYHDDHRHVIKTLMDVVTQNPHILKEPPPDVRLENFGAYSIDYQIYVWIDTPLFSAIVKNEINQAILDAFEEQNISIPFPTTIEIKQPWKDETVVEAVSSQNEGGNNDILDAE